MGVASGATEAGGVSMEAGTQSRSSSDSLEPNGILGTGYDAESAGAARVGVRGIGRLSTVHRYLEAAPQSQRLVIGIIDPADLEHGVGAHLDAVALSFAARMINDGQPSRWLGAAPLAGPLGFGGGATGLLSVEAGRRLRHGAPLQFRPWSPLGLGLGEGGTLGRRPILARRRRPRHARKRCRRDFLITNDPVDHPGLAEHGLGACGIRHRQASLSRAPRACPERRGAARPLGRLPQAPGRQDLRVALRSAVAGH